jgi:hypothetical protein
MAELKHHQIIPDVIDAFEPSIEITVKYPHGTVSNGNEMKVEGNPPFSIHNLSCCRCR